MDTEITNLDDSNIIKDDQEEPKTTLDDSSFTNLSYNDIENLYFPGGIPSEISESLNVDKNKEAGSSESIISDTWKSTLEKAVSAIVSIKASYVRFFDTESTGTAYGTGFVVDAERGLILTNRHIIGPGPTVAQAIFQNYEEVDLTPLYIDPVHDFGFFRFNPKDLKFMKLTEIKLCPEKATLGLDIRVVGNDAGEKISILSGTLSRLDRKAPNYGSGKYNDVNVFYLQAASGSSGGSSGSPVLDIYGDAVALNCGSSCVSASSYYFPLDRVVRAFRKIQNGEEIPRGTLQAEFEYTPYHELSRLGLPHDVEKLNRFLFPESTGMFCVTKVLPEGPGDKKLQNGDILVALDGKPISNFIDISEILDNNVGHEISVSVIKQSQPVTFSCTVQSFYDITPARYVEVADGIVAEVSYQLARSYNLPIKGVYVAFGGYMFLSADIYENIVLVSINHKKTETLEEFIDVISSLTIGSRVPIEYFPLSRKNEVSTSVMKVMSQWFPFKLAVQNKATGLWDYTDLLSPKVGTPLEPQTIPISELGRNFWPADRVWPSYVSVEAEVPFYIDGAYSTRFYGPGYILDKDKGIVLCDRNTVITPVSDIFITFFHSLIVPAKLLFLHPVYNVAFIKYDPTLLGESKVKNLEFNQDYLTGKKRLEKGDETILVGSGVRDSHIIVRKTRVSSRKPIETIPCNPPRWRPMNTETILLEDNPNTIGGLLCDSEGLVTGIWLDYSIQDANGSERSYTAGLDLSLIQPVIDSIINEKKLGLYSIDVEVKKILPSVALAMGVSNARIQQFSRNSNGNTSLYQVSKILTNERLASKELAIGDVLLEIDGELVDEISKVALFYDKESVNVTLVRKGKEINLDITTSQLPNIETKRFIQWAGVVIQGTYRAVQEQVSETPSDIYIVYYAFGSNAQLYGLVPKTWITHVEGIRVNTIDDFVKTVKSLTGKSSETSPNPQTASSDIPPEKNKPLDKRYVRLTVVDFNGKSKTLSMRVDDHYWPMIEHKLNDDFTWSVSFGLEKIL
ncbi:hypothetical protein BB560_002544 [Smittium megazygosporum]|uniref:Pro-apoptotic serine protease nma111 n=1 Tax=Smittium megazygosporum TaxID=133381 RepID=A0A2T9ZBE3_9FUNG|nr:hypothetical protein BB560_003636 [Smittium megazygosporum]PVV02995.1 hypothetical protein BB560_002544 [Smittium megazygosporum]